MTLVIFEVLLVQLVQPVLAILDIAGLYCATCFSSVA
jgi:hypothetical protein